MKTTKERKRLLRFLIGFRQDNNLTWMQVMSIIQDMILPDEDVKMCMPDVFYEQQRDDKLTEGK